MDKTTWGPGPWQTEPDELSWTDERTGLACHMQRHDITGTWCGYVGVPPGHAFFGWGYHDHVEIQDGDLASAADDVDVVGAFLYAMSGGYDHGTIELGMILRCHRGITWAGELPDSDKPGASRLWWFGFDTAHAWDTAPGLDAAMRRLMPPEYLEETKRLFDSLSRKNTYRDLDYVRTEVTSLAFQLRQLETRVLVKTTVGKAVT
jgi:hypothetical protein